MANKPKSNLILRVDMKANMDNTKPKEDKKDKKDHGIHSGDKTKMARVIDQ